MMPFNSTIRRKALNSNGKIGSLYDAFRDEILEHNIQNWEHEFFEKATQCQVIRLDLNQNLLEKFSAMNYEDQLLESLVCQMVPSVGVASLIDYPGNIDPNMFLFHCLCPVSQQDIFARVNEKCKSTTFFTSLRNATHMITKVTWGFEIVCLISVRPTENSAAIISSFTRIVEQLQRLSNKFQLRQEEIELLGKLNLLRIHYSDKVNLSEKSLVTIFNNFHKWREDRTVHQPIEYELQSLGFLFKSQTYFKTFNHRYRTSMNDLENIRKISAWVKESRDLFDAINQETISSVLNEEKNVLMKQYSHIYNKHVDFMKACKRDLLRDRESNKTSPSFIKTKLETKDSSLETSSLAHFHSRLVDFHEKIRMFYSLQGIRLKYLDVNELINPFPKTISTEILRQTVIKALRRKSERFIVWFSSYRSKIQYPEQWNEDLRTITNKMERHSGRLHGFYIDCSNISQSLSLPKIEIVEADSRMQREKRTINALLLGESGVGKSTFINAFVNYLRFDSLSDAEKAEPTVLVPASFITTEGSNFEEVVIQCGAPNLNEFHNSDGQSVTQTCRSYVFRVNAFLDVRLIDTPGMCDTRGINQDNLNIEHIVSYIKKYKYLDAICILLNPDNARLNIWFRSFLQNLLDVIDPKVTDNIVFCFTNTRPFFFTPGNTGPILRRFLKSKPFDSIPYTKENVFCFDSESFRYLLCIRQNVTFDEDIIQSYHDSWNRSVTLSKELLKYIYTRTPYKISNLVSRDQLVFQLERLTSHIDVYLRLMIYNTCLYQVNIVEWQIVAEQQTAPIKLCSWCVLTEVKNTFPLNIIEYTPKKREDHRHCLCQIVDKYLAIDSIIVYKKVTKKNKQTREKTEKELEWMIDHFNRIALLFEGYLKTDDPMGLILKTFSEHQQTILDETKIYTNVDQNVRRWLQIALQMNENSRKKYHGMKAELNLGRIEQEINRIQETLGISNDKEKNSTNENDETYVEIGSKISIAFQNLL